MAACAGGRVEDDPLGAFQGERRERWNLPREAGLRQRHPHPFARVEHHGLDAVVADARVGARGQVQAAGDAEADGTDHDAAHQAPRGETPRGGCRPRPRHDCQDAGAECKPRERRHPDARGHRIGAGRVDDGREFGQCTEGEADARGPCHGAGVSRRKEREHRTAELECDQDPQRAVGAHAGLDGDVRHPRGKRIAAARPFDADAGEEQGGDGDAADESLHGGGGEVGEGCLAWPYFALSAARTSAASSALVQTPTTMPSCTVRRTGVLKT